MYIDFSFSEYKLNLNVTYGNVFTENIIFERKKHFLLERGKGFILLLLYFFLSCKKW